MNKKFFSILVLISIFFRTVTLDALDWRKTQEMWWSDSGLIKDLMVQQRLYTITNEPFKNNVDLSWSIEKMVMLFDNLNGKNAKKDLVALASYNLGAASGELLKCLIARKGKDIGPEIRAQLRSKAGGECFGKFGSVKGMCLSSAEYENRLKVYLELISKNSPCYLEK